MQNLYYLKKSYSRLINWVFLCKIYFVAWACVSAYFNNKKSMLVHIKQAYFRFFC